MKDFKSTTFFECLQNDEALDLRDNRGKRHDIALILTQFVMAILCNRDGKLSSIWRHMNAHYAEVIFQLGLCDTVPKKRYPDRISLKC